MEILLLLFAEDAAYSLPNLSVVWSVLGVMVLGALAILGLMAKNKQEIHLTESAKFSV